MITQNQVSRLTEAFQIYAGNEPVKIETMGSRTVYVFGSELAVLRISRYYSLSMHENKAEVLYSENLKTWVFRLDLNL